MYALLVQGKQNKHLSFNYQDPDQPLADILVNLGYFKLVTAMYESKIYKISGDGLRTLAEADQQRRQEISVTPTHHLELVNSGMAHQQVGNHNTMHISTNAEELKALFPEKGEQARRLFHQEATTYLEWASASAFPELMTLNDAEQLALLGEIERQSVVMVQMLTTAAQRVPSEVIDREIQGFFEQAIQAWQLKEELTHDKGKRFFQIYAMALLAYGVGISAGRTQRPDLLEAVVSPRLLMPYHAPDRALTWLWTLHRLQEADPLKGRCALFKRIHEWLKINISQELTRFKEDEDILIGEYLLMLAVYMDEEQFWIDGAAKPIEAPYLFAGIRLKPVLAKLTHPPALTFETHQRFRQDLLALADYW